MQSDEINGMVSNISKLFAVEDSIAPTKSSKGRDEKNKIVNIEMQLILYGHWRCQDETFRVSMLRISCWDTIPGPITNG